MSGAMSQPAVQLLGMLLFLTLAFGFDVYCMKDLAKAEATLHFRRTHTDASVSSTSRLRWVLTAVSSRTGGSRYLDSYLHRRSVARWRKMRVR